MAVGILENEQLEKEKARISKVIEWLCVEEGERRHLFLSEKDRIEYFKIIMRRVSSIAPHVQCSLVSEWFRTVVREKRNMDLAVTLLKCAVKEMYSSSHLEAWAETRYINLSMKAIPMRLAREYAQLMTGDKRLTGLFVTDMQRIKRKLKYRFKKNGEPRRDESVPARPVFPQTKRQKAENEIQANLRAQEGNYGSFAVREKGLTTTTL